MILWTTTIPNILNKTILKSRYDRNNKTSHKLYGFQTDICLTILFWFSVVKLQPENRPQLRYVDHNCSNIQLNWWQHSYKKLWWLKYGWQTIKAIRSWCEVQPYQIRTANWLELYRIRSIRIANISFISSLKIS